MTVRQIEIASGISNGTIQKLLYGETKNPSRSTERKLRLYLDQRKRKEEASGSNFQEEATHYRIEDMRRIRMETELATYESMASYIKSRIEEIRNDLINLKPL